SALEEISATTNQNAARAAEADTLMRSGRQTAESAARTMDHLTRSMAAISASSNQVAAVLKSIDEIAFHTNILALNAAVEAARAGADRATQTNAGSAQQAAETASALIEQVAATRRHIAELAAVMGLEQHFQHGG